jgi:hypothetical protein
MKKLLLLVLLISSTFICQAQNHIIVKGKVIDSTDKSPIEFATVSIINGADSSLISYTVTDKLGEFSLTSLPLHKSLKILISFFNYQKFKSSFIFNKAEIHDMGIISLSAKILNEVSISGERPPISIKKDTVEFNSEAFKTRPNAVIEELLRKLPGVQVNANGSITFNGRHISKLLIDGKQFFGTNPTIATRNLDADIVSKIQIYDDRENDPDHLISENKVNKIIDIRLKKAIKKSTFGKVYAGGGTGGRYESGGLFNMFRDTLQISLIGVSNNLNKTGFSNDELNAQGGFRRGGGLSNVSIGGRGNGGIEQATSGGFNLNTDYGKKLKMNLLYFYSQSTITRNTVSHTQQFLNDTAKSAQDTSLLSTSQSHSEQISYKHTLSGLINWNPDSLTSVRYTPQLNFTSNNANSNSSSGTVNNFNEPVNNSLGDRTSNGTGVQIQQDFIYHHAFKKKGESFNITHSLQINPNKSDQYYNYELQSNAASILSDTIHRYTDNSSVNTSINLGASYRYPFTDKLTGDVGLSGHYSHSIQQSFVFDKDNATGMYDLFSQNLSVDVGRNLWVKSINPHLTYKFNSSVSIIAGYSGRWLDIDNSFSDHSKLLQNYFNLLPSLQVDAGNFSLNYSKSVQQPSVTDLQPTTIVYSSLYSFTGNPLLKPTVLSSGNISFHSYNLESRSSYYISGSFSTAQNSIVRQQTISTDGVQTATLINHDGQSNFQLSFSYNKQFRKTKDWQTSMSTSLYTGTSKNAILLNNVDGWQNNYTWSLRQGVSTNWKDILNLTSSANAQQTFARYTSGNNIDQNATVFRMTNDLIARWPKKIVWEANQQYSYTTQVAQGFPRGINVLSSSVALLMFKKDRGQIKLSVYDMLNQSTGVYRSFGNNSISDQQYQILKRYFMLTYQYKFSKSK